MSKHSIQIYYFPRQENLEISLTQPSLADRLNMNATSYNLKRLNSSVRSTMAVAIFPVNTTEL